MNDSAPVSQQVNWKKCVTPHEQTLKRCSSLHPSPPQPCCLFLQLLAAGLLRVIPRNWG